MPEAARPKRSWESQPLRRGRVVEDAGRPRQRIVRFGVIDHLCMVYAEPSANRSGAAPRDVICEPNPWSKIGARISEGL